jgi:hypothetical protein
MVKSFPKLFGIAVAQRWPPARHRQAANRALRAVERWRLKVESPDQRAALASPFFQPSTLNFQLRARGPATI